MTDQTHDMVWLYLTAAVLLAAAVWLCSLYPPYRWAA